MTWHPPTQDLGTHFSAINLNTFLKKYCLSLLVEKSISVHSGMEIANLFFRFTSTSTLSPIDVNLS